MTIDRAVMAFAGMMVLLSLALTHFLSPWWIVPTAFVGLNLIQAAFTGFCPAAMARIRHARPRRQVDHQREDR